MPNVSYNTDNLMANRDVTQLRGMMSWGMTTALCYYTLHHGQPYVPGRCNAGGSSKNKYYTTTVVSTPATTNTTL